MYVAITQCSIAELENDPNLPALLDEYAAECSIEGLPHPSAKVELYKQLEATGWLAPFAAYADDKLIGFIFVLCSVIPHYGVHVATTESYFVARDKRRTGAGIMLLNMAERHAKDKGSPGLLVSAPSGGVLAEVLQSSHGYVETNRVFFRRFK